ncbi:COX assembly mitochondrial protein 2 homolog isoform X4 [Podarcis raffonei]|nr:COX assembly mitochondrial protein 2 homolog isoform X4 [Podarcis raffonei]
MTSSEQKQNEIESERVAGNTRIVETELRCTYPNERRERNQIYTLLSISNSINEQEERSLDCTNGTGWEEAVQGWGKTAPFAYLQLQKKARKAKTSESVSGCQSVSGCLYCLDLNQVIDKSLEQDPKGTEPLKTDFKLSTCAATDRIPEKQHTLLLQSATIDSSATEDSKKENCYGKIYSGQTSQGEKKKVSLKDAQATLSERRFFLMKESPLFQGEKRTVPIKEYSILTTGKPKTLETVKYKDTKGYEPPICNHVGTETATVKPSLVLPPLKDATLKTTLDPSAKKSKTVTSQ